MAINFPNSPSTNDIFTSGSITYKWDGAKWIGTGLSPVDRLVEGSNSLTITNNDLVWSGGNVVLNTVFHVPTNGNVGIATTAPRTKLHVLGAVHTDRFYSNPTSLDTSVTFPESGGAVNGGVFGPYTINSGVTLTIASGSTFKVL